ncbi:MAG: UPF0149 family protein [Burkholderiales bacterium]|nr:UPF0149 family protein [Burkholderiales bacterium]
MDYPAYDPGSAVTPLTAAELTALDALLQALPADGAMTLDGLDGYLTALAVGPSAVLAGVPSAEWLPVIWGGDGEGEGDREAGRAGGGATATPFPFASRRQRKSTVVQVLRHLRHLQQQLAEAPDDWEPIFSVAEQGAQEWADARDWCTGFLQAVDLQPSAWDGLWDDPALGPALAPLLVLGGGLGADPGGAVPPADLDDLAVCDGLSRAVPDGVLRLLALKPA